MLPEGTGLVVHDSLGFILELTFFPIPLISFAFKRQPKIRLFFVPYGFVLRNLAVCCTTE